jgi:uncharacterized protein YxjI
VGLGDRRRERREERRDERRGVGRTKYRMRQKLVSIGDDSWIEDEEGRRAFKVNGKAMRIRDTLVLEDAAGNELLQLQERKLRVRDTMEIEDPSGRTVATVKKAMFTPLRERFTVEVADGEDMDVQGNIVDHEYTISRGGQDVAEVSKRWFRIADTYGIEIAEGQNDVLLLAVAAVIDDLTHDVG